MAVRALRGWRRIGAKGIAVALATTVSALISVSPGPAGAAPKAQQTSPQVGTHAPLRTGHIGGIVPSRINPGGATPGAATPLAGVGTSCTLSCGALSYHGGPVQHNIAVYAIFWRPTGFPNAFPANYETVLNQYLTDVAADSYKTTDTYAVATQYYDSPPQTFISYNLTYGGALDVTDALPASDCKTKNYKLTDGNPAAACIVQADLQAEVAKVRAARPSLPTGTQVQYLLITPPDLADCIATTDLPTSGNCLAPQSGGGFCAYHGYDSTGTTYSNLPYAAVPGCDPGERPNNNAADATSNVMSHEMNESITDPHLTAWWRSSDGAEDGDICNFNFQNAAGAAGQLFTQTINGHNYYTQTQYSNQAGNCVNTNTAAQPTASFTSSPANPAVNATVTFTSKASTTDAGTLFYNWDFGDGSTPSTAASPTHAYTSAGSYNVSLVVTDSPAGGQVHVVNPVSVGPPSISSVDPVAGPVGTTVTIAGSNLLGATAVSFGGVSATTFNVVSATSVTAVVPATAVSGAVQVTTPAGAATGTAFTLGTDVLHRFEETDPNFAFSSGWFSWANANQSGGAAEVSSTSASTATFTFTGTMVRWIGESGPDRAIGSIAIDGVSRGTVDTYAPSYTHQAALFTATALAAGSHVITITWTGRNAAAAATSYLVVDAIDVAP